MNYKMFCVVSLVLITSSCGCLTIEEDVYIKAYDDGYNAGVIGNETSYQSCQDYLQIYFRSYVVPYGNETACFCTGYVDGYEDGIKVNHDRSIYENVSELMK